MPPVDRAGLIVRLELTLAAMSFDARLLVRAIVALFEWLAIVRYGRRFSALGPHKQAAWLAGWTHSRLTAVRLMAKLVLTLLKPAALDLARQGHLGYPSDRLDQVAAKEPADFPPERVVATLERDRGVRCQVVVIGSGAGGAVVAAELAEHGVDVVMIEEGRVHRHGELGRDPLKNLCATYREGGATIALGSPPIPIPIGSTVGGTTTINSGTCLRVAPSVLEKWRTLGLPSELERYYARVEERISVRVVPPELLGGSSRVIARGAHKLGLAHGPLPRNVTGCQMSAVCAFGCPIEAKQSTNVSYVPSALRAGATLYTGLRAERVLVEGGRAVGVVARLRGGGPTLTVRAEAVVSACGSIPGVSFLWRSGLRSPHLGRHLTIHPATKIVALMPELVDGWNDTPQGYAIHALADRGILYEGAFVPPEYASITLPFTGPALTKALEQYRHMAMFGFMIADGPNGRVRPGPKGRSLITYRLSHEDLEKVRTGLDLLAEVFFAAGAERILLPLAGGEEQTSLAAAKAALRARLDRRRLELIAFHPLGTARMAVARRDGVVNAQLESFELPGLHVVDGSVFPTSLGVNPQLTIMAVATRAAERLAVER